MKALRFKSRSCRAFTLIEIMLSIGIMAGLMVAIYATWSVILRSSQAGLDAAVEAHRLRVATRAIEEAIQSAVIFELNMPHYFFMADTESDFAALSLASHLSESFPGSGLFHDQPLRRVAFTVESSNQINYLLLSQYPILTPPMAPDEKPYELVLLKNVGVFVLEFWDLQLNDWTPQWIYTNRFPAMIRYSLGTLLPDEKEVSDDQIIRRIIHVPSATVRASWQRPALGNAPQISPRQPARLQPAQPIQPNRSGQ